MVVKKTLIFAFFVASIFIARQYVKVDDISSKTYRLLQTSNTTSTNITLSGQCGTNLSSYLANSNNSATDITNILGKYASSDSLKQYLAGNITSEQYAESLAQYTVPFVVMTIFSGLGLLCAFGACFCKPSLCCISRKYTHSEQKCCMYPLVFCSVGLIVISVIAFVANSVFYNGIQGISCDIEGGYSTLINGASITGFTWGGLSNIAANLTSLASGLHQFGTASDQYFANTSYLNNTSQYYTMIENLALNYDGETVPNPSPFSTKGALTVPLFQSLGSPKTPNTVTYNMTYDFIYTEQSWAEALLNISQTAEEIAKNTSFYAGIILDAASNMTNLTQELNNSTSEMFQITDAIRSNSQQYNDTISKFYSIILTLVLLAVVAGSIITCCDKRGFRVILHLIWIILKVTTILSFVLITFMVPFTYISMQGCGVGSDILSSPSGYQQYAKILNFTYSNQTQVCLFGDGSTAESFGFSSAFTVLDNVTQSFSIINQIQQQTLNTNLNNNNATVYQGQVTNAIMNFAISPPDSSCLAGKGDCVLRQISFLDSWSDYSINGNQTYYCPSVVTQDTWTLGSTCASNYSNTLSSADVTQYFGSPTCINPSIFATSTINKRYSNNAFKNCKNLTNYTLPSGQAINNVPNMIQQYWQSIELYQQAFTTSLQNLNNDLTTYINNVSALDKNLTNLTNGLSTIQQSVQNMSNAVTDPQVGLIAISNCSFAGTYVKQIYSDYCGNVLPNLTMLTTVTIIFAFFLWFVSIAAFCLAMRNVHRAEDSGDSVYLAYPNELPERKVEYKY